MNSFIIILLGIVFLMTLGYYISSLYSVHYKTVWKNKSNIKYRVKTSSITSYAPLFGLILATIIFAFYFRNSGYSPIITGAMVIITIVVGLLIRLSIKELYFFDTYLVFKNNYIEYLFKTISSINSSLGMLLSSSSLTIFPFFFK